MIASRANLGRRQDQSCYAEVRKAALTNDRVDVRTLATRRSRRPDVGRAWIASQVFRKQSLRAMEHRARRAGASRGASAGEGVARCLQECVGKRLHGVATPRHVLIGSDKREVGFIEHPQIFLW